MPAKARHILERDWCDLSAYDRAIGATLSMAQRFWERASGFAA